MTVQHLTDDLLSAFIDEELISQERRKVDNHLKECDRCQAQLKSLRRVSQSLRSLESLAPPSTLDMVVQRHLSIERPKRWSERHASRFRIPISTPTLLLFTVVFGFAFLVFQVSQKVDEVEQRTPSSDLVMVVTQRVGERVFMGEGDGFRETVTQGEPVDREVLWGDEDVRELMEKEPDLKKLAGREVILAVGPEVWRISGPE